MLKLEVIDNRRSIHRLLPGPDTVEGQHFVITTTEPMRVEVSATEEGFIIAHAYRGAEVDMEQEPDLVFDGTNEDGNHDITKE